MVHYDDLWRLNIIVQPIDPSAWYFLNIEIQDDRDATLWEVGSYTFQIDNSSFWITPATREKIEPLKVKFSDQSWYSRMTSLGGVFPHGRYRIIYHLIETTKDCNWAGRQVATAAYDLNIVSLNPPMLVLPYDRDTVDPVSALFAWIPPFPKYSDQNITYRLRIAEISGMQHPAQALTVNPSYYESMNLLDERLLYPSETRPLTPGKRYAWQVIAYSDDAVAGYSEEWSFVVREGNKLEDPPPITPVFLHLSESPRSLTYQINEPALLFRYSEEYGNRSNELSYRLIREKDNKVVKNGEANPFIVNNGYNTFSVALNGIEKGLYRLIVRNDKNKRYYLRFRLEGAN